MKKLILLLSVLFVVSCSKEEVCEPIPTMGSSTLNEAGYSSITVSGTITPPTCDVSIISQGFVLDDEQLPTISKTKKIASGTSIQAVFEDLTPNTTYFVRTFLTNVDGDYYGPQIEIKTQNPSVNFSETGVEQSFESAIFSSKYSFAEGAGLNVKTKGFEIDGQDYPDSDSANGIISVSAEYGYYNSDEKTFSTDDPSSTLSSLNIENVGFDNADFSAVYENNYSGADITSKKGFMLALSEDFTAGFNKYESDTDSKTFKLSKTNLTSGVKYYIKAYVENSFGTYTSESKSFETKSAGYNFKTNSASEIDYDSVKLSSEFNQIEGDALEISERGFLISTNDDMSSPLTKIDSNTDGNISVDITSLTTNTKYYFQAYLINKYSTWTSEVSNFVTKSAVPEFSFDVIDETIWFDKTKANFSMTIPNDVSITSFNIDIENLVTGKTTRVDYLDNQPNYKGGTFEYEMTSLVPNTNFTVTMILENPYGTFKSNNYSFTTKDDTPFMKSFTTNPEQHQVQFSYNINEVDGDVVSKIYLKYKNSDDESYITVNLENTTNSSNEWNTDNQSVLLENMVQGPEYEYILHYENEWNTHTYSHYDTKGVEYKVGDEKFGGIIAYIDESGYHGIVLAKQNSLSENILFLKNSNDLDLSKIEAKTYNTGSETNGMENSINIKEHYNNLNIDTPAIDYAFDYENQGYKDWYVLSYRESVNIRPYLESSSSDSDYENIVNLMSWTSNSVSFGSATANLDYSGFKFYVFRKSSSNNTISGQQNPFNYSRVLPARKF